MKRLLSIIAALLLGFGINAQNTEINRLLMHQDNGITRGFVIEKIDSLTFTTSGNNTIANFNMNGTTETYDLNNIDSLSFASVEGEVAANINIISHNLNSIILDVTRTPSCVAFKITCMSSASIASMPEDYIANYINENISDVYFQDLSSVEFTNLDLSANTDYYIVTIAYDEYGILCNLTKEKFITKLEELVGDPDVKAEVVENNLYDFTVRFTPNEDVSKYSVIVGEEGAIENQFYMFSYTYNWLTICDMISDWGLEFTTEETYKWTNKSPNTYYEIYIQPWDVEGNPAPYKIFKFKTKSSGGEGIAKVEITLGEYIMNDWFGEMLPSQFLTFTPNDQTSAYRFGVYLAENYNADVEGYQEDLFTEPSMPTPGWFQYETLTTDYQIDPGTSCVAIAAAKNSNDEWGPVTELFFTTPDNVNGKTVFTSSGRITGRHDNIVPDKEQRRHNIIMYELKLNER